MLEFQVSFMLVFHYFCPFETFTMQKGTAMQDSYGLNLKLIKIFDLITGNNNHVASIYFL